MVALPGDGEYGGGVEEAPHVDGVAHRVPVLAHVVSEPAQFSTLEKYSIEPNRSCDNLFLHNRENPQK
jgi:hypothetical protein